MKVNKERRREIRIPLLNESIFWTETGNMSELNTSKISDISKHGMFIETIRQPGIGEIIDLLVKLPAELGALDLKAKVVWRRWAVTKKDPKKLGFSVQITYDNPKYEKIMDSFLIYLRNKQIIQVSKRILEEYNNRITPTRDKEPTL